MQQLLFCVSFVISHKYFLAMKFVKKMKLSHIFLGRRYGGWLYLFYGCKIVSESMLLGLN